MKLYKCAVSGDEMFSDIYKIKEGARGIVYEVEGKVISRTEGSIDDTLIGGNASQECPTEQAETSTVSGVDIVLNHNLKEISLAKADYRTHIKGYMKQLRNRVQERNPDEVKTFTENAQKVISEILNNFVDYQLFLGESLNSDGMIGLLNYREDGITPYMLFFKDGLEIEKC
ncbi:translationally-controlled tumor protein homolog [Chiloscyllium plagiosum]|uniref:translationally-controlled tumor protein homolog n=1 Tax=Chiloscyllium plagiosum TaxID=36176 RepID=UPI001CB7E726|nr:translationally-controlled tumor protein homolog [Chiloscyllium plagiosum]